MRITKKEIEKCWNKTKTGQKIHKAFEGKDKMEFTEKQLKKMLMGVLHQYSNDIMKGIEKLI